MTPEGRVKKQIKEVLDSYAPEVYYHMPVQNGMGKPTLDFTGCAWGLYFTIESKAPGKHPTQRQEDTIEEVENARGKVFVIDCDENYPIEPLELWLVGMKAMFEKLDAMGD